MNVTAVLRRNAAFAVVAVALATMSGAAAPAQTNLGFDSTIQSDSAVQDRLALLGTQLHAIQAQQAARVATDLIHWKAYRNLLAAGHAAQARTLLDNIRQSQSHYIATGLREAAVRAQIDLLNHVAFAVSQQVRPTCDRRSR